ncbi:MAG: hypothetical protein IT287_06270 [Bdellovibrionaceae bacterium]|nr:hypothetical protein [Pseudobdellovibrionaceae bacterium]
MKIVLLFIFLAFPFSADAYIPKLSTILGRISSNNGATNGLVIQRSVFFKDDNVACSETWYIANADAMKVVVSGKNTDQTDWSFEIIYKNGKRQTLTTDGETKTFPLSPEFFEQLLHYRSARALQSRLENYQILPAGAGSSSASSYVSLDRYRGAVVYKFGAQETKNAQPPPLLFVEQDSFVPKRLRLGSQIEVEFTDSTELDEGAIKQPSQQTILWKNTTVVTKITSLEKAAQNKVSSHLKFESKKAKMPENENIKEFYSRFR